MYAVVGEERFMKIVLVSVVGAGWEALAGQEEASQYEEELFEQAPLTQVVVVVVIVAPQEAETGVQLFVWRQVIVHQEDQLLFTEQSDQDGAQLDIYELHNHPVVVEVVTAGVVGGGGG